MNTSSPTPPGQSLRQRLAERLERFPFLRLLVLDSAFLVVLCVVLVVAAGVGAVLPKVWRTTPEGFRPEVKVSLLDKMQAWSLRRKAQRLAAAGEHTEALQTWVGAIANDPGNLEVIREWLRHLAGPRRPDPSTLRSLGRQARWLFALGGTNRSDVGLVALAFDRAGLRDAVLSLLDPHRHALLPAEESAYRKALFLTTRFDQYAEQRASAAPTAPDAELDLCEDAYVAGWGPAEAAPAAAERLARAAWDAVLGPVATRAQLMVSLQRLDPDGYAEALRRLPAGGLDEMADHVRYWRLLATVGRLPEARRQAEDHPPTPRNASEMLTLTDGLLALGLSEQALRDLRSAVRTLGEEPGPAGCEIWMRQAELLIQAKAWDDLYAAALQMRVSPHNALELAGMSFCLEGRALIGLNRFEESGAAFARAVEASFPSPLAALTVSKVMVEAGQFTLARQLLDRLEPGLRDDLRYWQWISEAVSAERKDHTRLVEAARQSHRLDPSHPGHRLNLAAALLIDGESVAEALAITRTLVREHPELPQARLLHGLALAQNREVDQAEVLLNGIPAGPLEGLDATVYHLAWMEVRLRQERFAESRQHLTSVDPNFLFPVQVERLERVRVRLNLDGG